MTSGSSKGHGKKGQKGLKGQKGQQKGSTSKAAAKQGGAVGTGPPPQKLMGSVALDPATFGGPGSLNKAKDLHSNEQIAGFREKQEDSVELQGHGQSFALPRPTVVPGAHVRAAAATAAAKTAKELSTPNTANLVKLAKNGGAGQRLWVTVPDHERRVLAWVSPSHLHVIRQFEKEMEAFRASCEDARSSAAREEADGARRVDMGGAVAHSLKEPQPPVDVRQGFEGRAPQLPASRPGHQ